MLFDLLGGTEVSASGMGVFSGSEGFSLTLRLLCCLTFLGGTEVSASGKIPLEDAQLWLKKPQKNTNCQ